MQQLRAMMRFSSLGLAIVSGAALMAQATTGGLSGSVRTSQGNPLPGVKVILTSPALFSPRVMYTDTKGEWRALLLPVGGYRIQAVKDGFVGSSAHDVRVGIGTALRQDFTLKETVQAGATVEVVGSTVELDKGDTKSSTNFSAEILDTLAAPDRGFYGAADLTAGVATSGNGGLSVRGGSTQDTLYRLNGTDIKDDYQGAQVGTWIIEDNVVDVQVVLSPLNARNGRALGGQVNVVTKTGGNDFEGSFRAHLARPSWGSTNDYTKNTPGQVDDKLGRTFDVAISGPIIKDRLWFALGTILTPSSTTAMEIGAGNPLAQGPMRTGDPVLDGVVANPPAGYAFASFLTAAKPYAQTYNSNYFEAKVTGAVSTNNTVELSYTGSGDTIDNRDPAGGLVRLQALGTQKDSRSAVGLNFRSVLSGEAFLDARFNRFRSKTSFPTGDPKYGTDAVDVWMDTVAPNPHSYLDVGYPFAQGISTGADRRNSTSGNINLSLFKDLPGGRHELDLGVEYYQADRATLSQAGADNRYFRTGSAYYNTATDSWLFPAIIWPYYGGQGQSSSGNTGLAPVMWQFYGQDGTTRNTTASLYANDSVTINKHLVAMAGLRYDRISVTDTTGARLAKAADFSPRLQLRYDVNGDSHHVLTVTAARFQGDFTSGFTAAFITQANSKEVSYGFSGLANQPDPYSGNPAAVQWLTYAQLTNPANYTATNTYLSNYNLGPSTAYAFSDSSKSYLLDPNLHSPYMDEATLTYRRSYDGGNFMRFTYVNRVWKDNWAFSTDYTPSQMATISDPSGSGLPDKLASTVHVFNSNALTRSYQGLEIEFLRKITPRFTVNGNYTYGRLTGNNNGGDNPLSTFRDNSVPGYYGNRQFLTQTMHLTDQDFAPTGPLASDQTHRARMSFTYDVPLDKGHISYSALLRYDSGNNWSAAYAHPLSESTGGTMPNIANAPPAPGAYTQYYGGRGQYTFNDVTQVDLKVSWRIPLGYGSLQLIGDLQVNNLFNVMEQATYSTATAALPYGADKMYLNTTSFGTFGSANPQVANYWMNGRSVGTSIGLRF